MAYTDIIPATDKQKAFLKTLLAERQAPADLRTMIETNMDSLSKVAASVSIGQLLKFDKVAPVVTITPAPVEVPVDHFAALRAELVNTPKSKYALPLSEVGPALLRQNYGQNDLLFVEVKNYAGKLFLNRLTGSVGGFSRSRFSAADGVTILRYIQKNPFKYAQAFATHYHVCGKCAAELTDPESRRLNFGPECRKSPWIARALGL